MQDVLCISDHLVTSRMRLAWVDGPNGLLGLMARKERDGDLFGLRSTMTMISDISRQMDRNRRLSSIARDFNAEGDAVQPRWREIFAAARERLFGDNQAGRAGGATAGEATGSTGVANERAGSGSRSVGETSASKGRAAGGFGASEYKEANSDLSPAVDDPRKEAGGESLEALLEGIDMVELVPD